VISDTKLNLVGSLGICLSVKPDAVSKDKDFTIKQKYTGHHILYLFIFGMVSWVTQLSSCI